MTTDDLVVRRASADDMEAVLELLRASMEREQDRRFEALFRWKHEENAFGASPMWVACDGERLVGLRVFMRWEFSRGDATLRAVRAVDTATHPDYQGRGIFTRLTLGALPDLTEEGVDFVFNTPNDKSRPGYLKMGWRALGRVPASIRPTAVSRLGSLRGARAPASHWSETVRWGADPTGALADGEAVDALLASRPVPSTLRTRLDAKVLQWRYGTSLLGYRAVLAGNTIADGVAFVRVRTRGGAREVVLALALVPGDDTRTMSALLRRVVATAANDADYLLALGRPPGFVPLPALGPVLTTRTLATAAPSSRREFALTLGDIELF
jgi:GNAT superfamily N-acetyltransferase